MGTITVDFKYDGQFLIYNRATGKVLFSKVQKDTKRYLNVGMVWGGKVAGKPVSYWLQQIKKDEECGKEA